MKSKEINNKKWVKTISYKGFNNLFLISLQKALHCLPVTNIIEQKKAEKKVDRVWEIISSKSVISKNELYNYIYEENLIDKEQMEKLKKSV